MSLSKTVMLRPAYMRDFSCTVSKCSDTCCKHWEIQIDRETYEKYVDEFSPLMNEYVSIRPAEDRSDALYGTIAHMTDGHCPFLSEERACRLHAEYGPDYLSNACALYPRATNLVDGKYEQSGDISCPVMARLILDHEDGLQFEEGAFEYDRADRQLFFIVADLSEPGVSVEERDMLLSVRSAVMALLSDRSMGVEERLLVLEEFHRVIAHHIKFSDLTGVVRYIDSLDTCEMQARAVDDMQSVDPDVRSGQIYELLDLISAFDPGVMPGVDRYDDLYSELLLGIEYSEGILLGDLASRFETIRKEHYDSLMTEHGYLMENYLLNDYFKNAEPFVNYERGNVYAGLFRLVQKFSLMRLFLVGSSAFSSSLSKERFIDVIQIVSRIIETNFNYSEFVERYIDENADNAGFARKFII